MKIKNNILKWLSTMRVAWSGFMAYRMNFLLQILGPIIVFFFIKYNLWNAIFATSPEVKIAGYSLQMMISYHLWTMLVSILAQGHSAINLSEDIRLGRISTYLIYPFNFWEFHSASFLAFQILQTLIATVAISIFVTFGFISLPSLEYLVIGYLYCSLVSIFWFCIQFFTGIIGFWLEDTWIIRVMFINVSAFLSGAIIPLELFPNWANDLLYFTPFPYLTYIPVKILMAEPINITQSMAILSLWIAIIIFVNQWIWRRGVRLYTAAGM